MEIIKKPILTEKASILTEKLNRYAFKVDHRANKIQIKSAVEAMFGVTVVAVNTAVVAGKAKAVTQKAGFVSGRAPKYKKAIITIKDGETIDFTVLYNKKMAVKRFKPVTPGTRFRIGADYSDVTTNVPEKSLVVKINKKSGGRNNSGKMTMRYLGGGHKKVYRLIDFKRDKKDIPAKVATIEYDPNRTARIALLHYADGEKRYIIAPAGLQVGQTVVAGDKVAPEVGNTLPLANIPLGSIIHNIELNPGQGGSIARSAGTYAQLSARDGKYAIIKLPSGETRMILLTCVATIGSVSNHERSNQVLGKAGRKRWLGRRPRVRGVAMNPVDHPMGGGEGRTSGGHPRSRTGVLAKGFKTRYKKKTSNRYIIERRKK